MPHALKCFEALSRHTPWRSTIPPLACTHKLTKRRNLKSFCTARQNVSKSFKICCAGLNPFLLCWDLCATLAASRISTSSFEMLAIGLWSSESRNACKRASSPPESARPFRFLVLLGLLPQRLELLLDIELHGSRPRLQSGYDWSGSCQGQATKMVSIISYHPYTSTHIHNQMWSSDAPPLFWPAIAYLKVTRFPWGHSENWGTLPRARCSDAITSSTRILCILTKDDESMLIHVDTIWILHIIIHLLFHRHKSGVVFSSISFYHSLHNPMIQSESSG